ncbi:MAG: translation initiation factor IF-2 [Planctomycetes bacterium]|nr:translation initiation factor IF-2 [Planctomycetota bacterium]
MPTRIYSLAKELKVDSKELVEICNKAGVPGKGSALASLSDEEVEKVKTFLSSGHRPASAVKGKPQRPTAATRERIKTFGPSRAKPSDVLSVRESAASTAARPQDLRRGADEADEEELQAPGRAEEDAPTGPGIAAETSEAEEMAAEQAATATAVAEPEAPEDLEDAQVSEEAEESAAVAEAQDEAVGAKGADEEAADEAEDRGEPVRPGFGSTSLGAKIKVVGGKGKKDDSKDEGDRGKPARPPKKKPSPLSHLASVPEAKPRTSPKKEEKAQKPIMRLPQDTIRDVKSGKKDAPLQQLAESVKRKKEGKPPVKTGVFAEPETPATAKGKGKRGKGKGAWGESDMAEMADIRQRRRRGKQRKRGEDEEGDIRRPRQLVRRPKHQRRDVSKPRKGKVALELPCTIRTFSEATGVPAMQVIRILMDMGMPVSNINVQLDPDVAESLAMELGVELEFRHEESLEDTLLLELEAEDEDAEKLHTRPPVVTFLGHVDHGKTSLLDAIIGTNVVAGEAGGITQHIRAYEIKKDGRSVAFVDTPGHEAFTEMRARGANVTDIAVLVIAADDGIMPQTEEAISHARAAGVPIVVALNKMDLAGADPNKVMQQLAAHELLPSEWGGNVEVVQTSAVKQEGIDDLLETLLTIAELNEFKANADRNAVGVCLEAEQEPGRGVIAKVIVKQGTLHAGDVVVCGDAHGRVKAMFDTLRPGKKRKKAGPSIPVNITGLDKAPSAGEKFYVLDDIAQAREIAASREERTRAKELEGRTKKVTFDDFSRMVAEGRFGKAEEVVEVRLVLRADTRGSIEAILKELDKFKEHPEVRIRMLHVGVGGVTEGDVTLAEASDAVIIAFNVIPDDNARRRADEYGVEIRRYDIIYKVTDDIRALLEGKLKPEEREIELGRAIVQQVFSISRVGAIAGCRVMQGSIERNSRIRIFRDGRNIGEYPLESLKHLKDDVKEVPRGMECGIKLSGFNDIKDGDLLEAYKIEEFARTLT